ncbi:MAG: D-TA family PLP-dependent enzyme [Anaerolineales bacterium]|nr:D-TA family PLP-dependent enzyme [Anaerolineales bacterium]
MRVDELETPVPVVDIDLMQANIRRLQKFLDDRQIANRPHIKTHKIPEIAQMQIDAGAVGITCQKVSEAEVMADAGCTDIFIPYNILGESKLKRLMNLAKRIKVSVTCDSEFVANGLSEAAQKNNLTLEVLVECDTGAHRCGVQTPEQAATLAKIISQLPNLHFGGLMTYPNMSSPYNEVVADFVAQTRELLKKENLEIKRVSGGGTPTMWQADSSIGITEHRAGIYVYGDRLTMRSGAVTLETCALRVWSTIVSRPTAERGILDAGSKALSSDLHGLDGYGYICEYPEAKIYALSEEHGHVDFSACKTKPQIGERVSIIPNHCCTVTCLFDEVVGMRNHQVEVIWKVAARGTVL